MAIIITEELAYASGHDAGNMSMRKAGRSKWNRDDFNLAAETTNSLRRLLYPHLAKYYEEAGVDGR